MIIFPLSIPNYAQHLHQYVFLVVHKPQSRRGIAEIRRGKAEKQPGSNQHCCCATTSAAAKPPKKMKAFASERELQDYLRKIAKKQKRAIKKQAMSNMTETVTVSASVSHAESVTNTRGRVFALLGYELVEGKVDGDRMTELRRISYAPQISQP